MKKTDKALRHMIRACAAQITPQRKNELLSALDDMYSDERKPSVHASAKRGVRRILAVAALAAALTMMISAAAVIRYYRTPGGAVMDKNGNPPPVTEIIASGENDRIISGEGYRIPRITWSAVDGITTLAVWSAPSADDLIGLRAVTDAGEIYPLTKTAFNLVSSYVGYTTDRFPAPQPFTLMCDSPAFSERVVLLTDDIITVQSACGGITLFGSAVENTVFYGVNDAIFPTMELSKTAEIVLSKLHGNTEITDTAGKITVGGRGGSRASEEELTTWAVYDITQGSSIASLRARSIRVNLNFAASGAIADGTAPHVYVPVPNDGQTLTGNWLLLDSDGFTYEINSVSREGRTLRFSSDEGLRYSGTHPIMPCSPGSWVITGILGRGMVAGSGTGNTWTMEFPENGWKEYQNEKGWIPICIFEMAYNYVGEWELDF